MATIVVQRIGDRIGWRCIAADFGPNGLANRQSSSESGFWFSTCVRIIWERSGFVRCKSDGHRFAWSEILREDVEVGDHEVVRLRAVVDNGQLQRFIFLARQGARLNARVGDDHRSCRRLYRDGARHASEQP